MNQLREQFPIFSGEKRLAYLDTASSAQKPQVVIDAIKNFYSESYANIHRGAYYLSAQATESYELARAKIAQFINSKSPNEIIFVRNATEGVNLVASTLLRLFEKGDCVLFTELEHHSNFVPWQIQSEINALRTSIVKITNTTQIDLEDFKSKLALERPKLCAFTMQSNAFGTITPYQEMIKLAHQAGALVLLDACQAVVHQQVDVQALDVDFMVFSAHKLYGPSGVGALYAKYDHLLKMPPYQGGGDMISEVTVSGSKWANPPAKFEAGTPAIAEVIGFAEAVNFIQSIGWELIADHDRKLYRVAIDILDSIPGVTRYGKLEATSDSSIISFNLEGVHPHDLSSVCDDLGVQIRAGFHCAMPALTSIGLHSTARMSLGVYNEEEDLFLLGQAIQKAKRIFKV